MRRNLGVFIDSDLLPVIFMNSCNVFCINQLDHLSLYRSLGVGVGIGRD